MKKTILIIMFILLIPLTFALYGGETWHYNFPECTTLEVNITGTDTIDKNEYTILNNCTNLSNNYYTCDCENDYNFTVKFHPGAVNNYTFDFNYMYERYEEDSTSSGGSSSGSGNRGSGGVFTATLKLNQSITRLLRINMISRFNIDGKRHTGKIIEIGDDYIIIEIQSTLKRLNLKTNEEQKIDFENNDEYDLSLILKSISGKTARVQFTHIDEYYGEELIIEESVIEEQIVEEPIFEINDTVTEIVDKVPEDKKPFPFKTLIIIIAFIAFAIWLIIMITKKKEDETDTDDTQLDNELKEIANKK